MPAMPMVPAADAARAVIGPDDPAAARIVIVGIIAAVIIAPVEVTVAVMRAIDPVAMKAAVAVESAIAIAAAVKRRRGAEAAAMETTTMETTAAEAAEMSAATMEAAATVKTSTMSATTAAMADLGDEIVGRSFRRG